MYPSNKQRLWHIEDLTVPLLSKGRRHEFHRFADSRGFSISVRTARMVTHLERLSLQSFMARRLAGSASSCNFPDRNVTSALRCFSSNVAVSVSTVNWASRLHWSKLCFLMYSLLRQWTKATLSTQGGQGRGRGRGSRKPGTQAALSITGEHRIQVRTPRTADTC